MTFSPFHLQKEPWSVGVDFGADHVKLVCLKKSLNKHTLMAHGFFQRSAKKEIEEAFAHPSIRHGNIRVNIENPSLKIRKIYIPPVPKEEINQIIQWGFKDVLSEPPASYLFRHHTLPEEKDKKEKPYLVFAMQKTAVQKYLEELKNWKIPQPRILAPNAWSLFLLLKHHEIFQPEDRVVVIDFGHSTTLFFVAYDGGILFSRPLGGISGESLTKQLGRNTGISDLEAETIKIGAKNEGLSEEIKKQLQSTFSNFLSRVVIEIQRSMDAYMMQFSEQSVTKIFITGGGIRLLKLPEHIEETLKIKTLPLPVFEKIDTHLFDQEKLREKESQYALACSLALA